MTRRPLRLVHANLGGANGWTQARCRAILLNTLDATRPDVLFVCEAFPITMDDMGLDPAVWTVLHDPTSADRAGSALIVRKSRAKITAASLRLYSLAGSGIRRRYSWQARLQVDDQYFLKVVSGHTPPKRAWYSVAPLWWTNARLADADVYGADFNRLAPFVAKALNRATRMNSITGFALRRTIPAAPARHYPVASDHPAVLTVIYPNN